MVHNILLGCCLYRTQGLEIGFIYQKLKITTSYTVSYTDNKVLTLRPIILISFAENCYATTSIHIRLPHFVVILHPSVVGIIYKIYGVFLSRVLHHWLP